MIGLVFVAGAFFGRFVVGGEDFWEQQFGLCFVAFLYQAMELFFQCACPRLGRAVELGLAGGAANAFFSGLNVGHRSIFLRCFSTNQKRNFNRRRGFVNRLSAEISKRLTLAPAKCGGFVFSICQKDNLVALRSNEFRQGSGIELKHEVVSSGVEFYFLPFRKGRWLAVNPEAGIFRCGKLQGHFAFAGDLKRCGGK